MLCLMPQHSPPMLALRLVQAVLADALMHSLANPVPLGRNSPELLGIERYSLHPLSSDARLHSPSRALFPIGEAVHQQRQLGFCQSVPVCTSSIERVVDLQRGRCASPSPARRAQLSPNRHAPMRHNVGVDRHAAVLRCDIYAPAHGSRRNAAGCPCRTTG